MNNTRSKNCQACGKQIVFLTTAKGSAMPVDAETIEIGDETFDRARHMPHFRTCSDPDRFRKKRTAITSAVLAVVLFATPAFCANEEEALSRSHRYKASAERSVSADIPVGDKAVMRIGFDILDAPPPYETIYGLVRVQKYKQNKRRFTLYHYQLFDDNTGAPGRIVMSSREWKGVPNRTTFAENHPAIVRITDGVGAASKLIPVGAAGAFVAGQAVD